MTELELIKRKLARETAARKEAEQILEFKANELYQANESLKRLNASLEQTVKNRTAQLAESHEKFYSLLSSVGDIIYDINAKGEFLYMNPVAERILGYKPEELIGKSYLVLVAEECKNTVTAFYANQLKLRQETSYLQFEAIRKNGTRVWLGQRVEMQFKNNAPPRISVVARDVQQLVDARKELENSEEKYRGMIEGMELGLLEVDNNGIIIKAYNQFCKMLGYSAKELHGKDPIKLLAKSSQVDLINHEDAKREDGQTGVYEVQLKRKDGEYIWVVISGTPFYDAKGQKMGTMGIHLDITDHKNLQQELQLAKEEAERAQQAEKAFLAKMSHELRTPLNAIIGMSNLLVDEESADKHREYAEDIQYAGNLLLGLITDVLDISKIEAGELTLAPSEVNLEQLISMLIRTLEHKAKDRNTELTYHINDTLPQQLLLDRNVVNQILLNLIGNAIKFTENGLINLEVIPIEYTNDQVLLQFQIKDTGIGIAPEKLPHIFEKYKQEKLDTANIYGGTGLGLSICKELVELHKGQISAKSKKGQGSTFMFSLWASLAKLENSYTSLKDDLMNDQALREAKILVAEDNHMNRKYLSNLLDRWSLNYVMVNDGNEALIEAQKLEYDLVLMDMEMPVMDGYKATKSIRTKSKNKLTPIIALTASASLEEKRKAFELGVDAYLTKPFTPDQVWQAIQSMIKTGATNEEKSKPGIFSGLGLNGEVDVAQLEQFYEGDLEHASLIFTLYLSALSDESACFQKLVSKHDLPGLKKWMHKMKPSIAMTGLKKLAAAFEELRALLKNADHLEQLNHQISEMQFYLTGSKDLVEQLQAQIEKRLNT